MKTNTTLTGIAIPLVLSLSAVAAADEPGRSETARSAGILSVMAGPRAHVAYAAPSAARGQVIVLDDGPRTAGRRFCSAGDTCEALGTVSWSRPLFRSFGICDAETIEELSSQIGRLGAIEQCTGRGDGSAVARPLQGRAPRDAFATNRDVESDPLAGLDL